MKPGSSTCDLVQHAWSQWVRLRHRRAFDRVEAFCLFVGYPRSGHSLVGALLNRFLDGYRFQIGDATEAQTR